MTARPGFPAVSGAATFQDIRRSLAGQVVKSAAGVLRTGILPASTGQLITGTASMVVNVQTCVIVLDRNGAVYLPNDGVQPVQLSSAPSSGSRWSVVYAKQRETESPFSDAAAGPLIDKVESTTSETAARNLLPAGARELGVWKIDAGVTTTNAASGVTYTETVPYTAMEGGTVLLRNATEMAAWTPHEGSLAYRLDTQQGYEYMGATLGWVLVFGKPNAANITPNSAGGVSAGTVQPRVVEHGGRVYPEGILTATSSTWNAGTEYGVGTAGAVPSVYAPKVEKRFPILSNDIFFGQLIFKTDGGINWRPGQGQSYTQTLNLPLDGPSWSLKALV